MKKTILSFMLLASLAAGAQVETDVSTNYDEWNTTVGQGAFGGCTSLTSMLIPLCTTLGTDCTYNGVFEGITGLTITVTCDASLLTCNAGAPDGDLCTLAANNTITVNGAPLSGCGGD